MMSHVTALEGCCQAVTWWLHGDPCYPSASPGTPWKGLLYDTYGNCVGLLDMEQ